MKLKIFGILSLTLTAYFPVFAEQAHSPVGQEIQTPGTQASVQGSAEFFTGRVRIDPIFASNSDINTSGAMVTFEPGSRSAWHTHPKGQYLVVTFGHGLTQEWGKPVKELRPGDVVWCPPGIKHWHGASAKTAMTHMAITGSDNQGNVNWMEKVTDEQYVKR